MGPTPRSTAPVPLDPLHQDEIQIGTGLLEFDQRCVLRIVVPRPGWIPHL
jgi:hypothetical protein